ncbi:MAG TPA: hypothetical protein VMJ10_28605 [Kofleriaceae bacterium]|nr:hypothetical protein [Kofleriaceae bacterium]
MRSTDTSPPRPPQFVQIATNNMFSSGTESATFTSAVTAGDLIIAAFDYDSSNGTVTAAAITDMIGSSYAMAGPFDGPNSGIRNRQYIGYGLAAQTATDTVQVTLSTQPGSYFELRLHEYASVSQTAPFDTAASAGGNSAGADAAQSAAITTSEPNELVFGMVIDGQVGAGTSFTLRGNQYGDCTEDMLAVTPGSYTVLATPTSTWTATAAAFRGQ